MLLIIKDGCDWAFYLQNPTPVSFQINCAPIVGDLFFGLSPPVKYFTDRSKAVLLLWIFYVFVLSCVCYVLCASVYMCFVVTCWERADLLALVCGVFCEFVTFPLVSWVRCGTWLYRFLIFATLLTLVHTSCLFLIQIKLMLLEFLTLLLDFLLTVKAVTLIIISGRDSAIWSAKEGKSGSIY